MTGVNSDPGSGIRGGYGAATQATKVLADRRDPEEDLVSRVHADRGHNADTSSSGRRSLRRIKKKRK